MAIVCTASTPARAMGRCRRDCSVAVELRLETGHASFPVVGAGQLWQWRGATKRVELANDDALGPRAEPQGKPAPSTCAHRSRTADRWKWNHSSISLSADCILVLLAESGDLAAIALRVPGNSKCLQRVLSGAPHYYLLLTAGKLLIYPQIHESIYIVHANPSLFVGCMR